MNEYGFEGAPDSDSVRRPRTESVGGLRDRDDSAFVATLEGAVCVSGQADASASQEDGGEDEEIEELQRMNNSLTGQSMHNFKLDDLRSMNLLNLAAAHRMRLTGRVTLPCKST